LIDQPINGCAIELFDKIDISYLSLAASGHSMLTR